MINLPYQQTILSLKKFFIAMNSEKISDKIQY